MASISLTIAAILTLLIGVAHSWLGEVRLIGPILSAEGRHGVLAHRFARQVLRFAWHITSLAWWGFAAIIGFLAQSPLDGSGRLILAITAVTFAVTGLITLVASRGRHLAWLVFFTIAGLAIVA
jgi:hypothetical protein